MNAKNFSTALGNISDKYIEEYADASTERGKKLLATGNGRCNMLNTDKSPFYFSKNNFHAYAVSRFNAKNNIAFFNDLGLYTRADEDGRVYPLSNQATTVLDTLRLECERLSVKFITDCQVKSVKKEKNGFCINNDMRFDKLVLACGGSFMANAEQVKNGKFDEISASCKRALDIAAAARG